jgi:hypothetical protein
MGTIGALFTEVSRTFYGRKIVSDVAQPMSRLIFISSVQSEFAEERKATRMSQDPLLTASVGG